MTVAEPPKQPDKASAIRAKLLESMRADLQEERSRKTSIETRATTLVAASTASLALLFGFGKDYEGRFHDAVLLLILAAGVMLIVAVFSGVRALMPRDYIEIDLSMYDGVLTDVDEQKGVTLGDVEEEIVEAVLEALKSARSNNGEKTKFFERAARYLVGGAAVIVVVLTLAVIGLVA